MIRFQMKACAVALLGTITFAGSAWSQAGQTAPTPAGSRAGAPGTVGSTNATTNPNAPAGSANTTPGANAGGNTGSTAATNAGTQAAVSMLTDDQIHAVVMVANQGEIDEANLAMKQGLDKQVKEFAKMMLKDHTGVKKELSGLAKTTKIKSAESPTKKTFEDTAQASMTRLKALKGNEFDQAYVEDQVKMHQDLLNSLDTELIPSAKNQKLKALLEKVRPSVAAHLDHAKGIQSKLGSQM